MIGSTRDASTEQVKGNLQGRTVSVKTSDSWYSRISRKVTENLHYVGYALAAAGVAALALGAISLIPKNTGPTSKQGSAESQLGGRSIILLKDNASFPSSFIFPEICQEYSSLRPSFDWDEIGSVESVLGDEEMEEVSAEQGGFYMEGEDFIEEMEETANDAAIAKALQESGDEASNQSAFRLTDSEAEILVHAYESIQETANDEAIARALQ